MAKVSYLLGIREQDAPILESWLGGGLVIGPRSSTSAIEVPSLDAVTEGELSPITRRLATGGPLYHAGGPTGAAASAARRQRQDMTQDLAIDRLNESLETGADVATAVDDALAGWTTRLTRGGKVVARIVPEGGSHGPAAV